MKIRIWIGDDQTFLAEQYAETKEEEKNILFTNMVGKGNTEAEAIGEMFISLSKNSLTSSEHKIFRDWEIFDKPAEILNNLQDDILNKIITVIDEAERFCKKR